MFFTSTQSHSFCVAEPTRPPAINQPPHTPPHTPPRPLDRFPQAVIRHRTLFWRPFHQRHQGPYADLLLTGDLEVEQGRLDHVELPVRQIERVRYGAGLVAEHAEDVDVRHATRRIVRYILASCWIPR